MELEKILPPLPGQGGYSSDQMLIAMRAAAVAALDEAAKQLEDALNDRHAMTNQYAQAVRSAMLIRRLRDTIMEGK